VLLVVLRALLLAAIAVALNLLTVAVAFGVLTFLFHIPESWPLGGHNYVDAVGATLIFGLVFGLSIDVGSLDRVGWLLTAAVAAAVVAKTGAGFLAGMLGGFTRRQSLNAGIALIAHGEFTIIVAQIASGNERIPASVRSDLVAFAGLYVLVTASLGIILMRESKAIGRRLYKGTTLAEGS